MVSVMSTVADHARIHQLRARMELADLHEAAIVLSAKLTDWVDNHHPLDPGYPEILTAARSVADARRLMSTAISDITTSEP